MKAITVIKFGGSLNKDENIRNVFFNELAALSKKESVVLIHGGGPEINYWMQKVGLETRFVDGLRYTDEPTLEIVEMVLSAKVNKTIVAALNNRGVSAVGISGKDGKIALCTRIEKLGFVGEPKRINANLIKTLIKNKYLPVISSLGFDSSGHTLNINSDSLAMGIACGLKAKRLILLTNVEGVIDKNGETIKCIKLNQINRLINDKVISGGMIPKIRACYKSIKSGVKEVWIINGSKGLKELKGTVVK